MGMLFEMLPGPSLALAPIVLVAFVAGYLLGGRRTRRSRRALRRELATRSLQMLAARAEQTRLLARLDELPRRERLVRLLMGRLRDAAARERELERTLAAARAGGVANGTLAARGPGPDGGGRAEREAHEIRRDALPRTDRRDRRRFARLEELTDEDAPL